MREGTKGALMRKTMVMRVAGLLTALALSLLTVAVASADNGVARFDAAGGVVYVGPSLVPGFPTSSSSVFTLNSSGAVKSVQVTTQNEQVIGVLGGVTQCEDNTGGVTCAAANAGLAGAFLNSLHTSVAKLKVTSQTVYPFPTPFGPFPVQVLNGNLLGDINSNLTIGSAPDHLAGTASLKILKGSTGTYACFVVGVPSPALSPCVSGAPGAMLFPIVLNVTDRGRFDINQGFGTRAGLADMRGRVEVIANVASPIGPVSGAISITKGKLVVPIPDDDENEDYPTPPEYVDDDDD